MNVAAQIMIGFVAMIHVYIMWFEMLAWTTKGPRIFKSLPRDLFEPTKTMAGNQGLYNGFLAAGLIWSLLIHDPAWKANVGVFFLACVAIAGIYGSLTVEKKIVLIQTLPAVIAAVLILV